MKKYIQHPVFWVLSFFVFVNFFKTGVKAEKIDYIYSLLFHATILPAVYINLEWLLPKFAKRKTWITYVLMLAALILLFSWINYMFFQNWSSGLLPDYFFISYFTLKEISFFFITYIALTSLIKLSIARFEFEKKLLETEKEKVQIELKALRSQINPHFFFNTLNSIYSMALEKDERLPVTVLQLSDLMRYFLYESRDQFVPLDKEIAVLKDYISLQRLRSTDELDAVVDIEGNMDNKSIAPLLLITFVENAFKHGAKGATREPFVRLNLKVNGNELTFRLENNVGVAANIPEPGDQRGVGLENVNRQLELLYPGRYWLNTARLTKSFIVELKLQMQQHV